MATRGREDFTKSYFFAGRLLTDPIAVLLPGGQGRSFPAVAEMGFLHVASLVLKSPDLRDVGWLNSTVLHSEEPFSIRRLWPFRRMFFRDGTKVR
jgi:hypothetical protein